MGLEAGAEMRGDIGRSDRLVEPQNEDDGRIRAAVTPVPVRLQQLGRRRSEGERVGFRELAAADGGSGGVDRDGEPRGERQRLLGIRCEDQNRRAGPSERSAGGRRDSEERRPDGIGNSSQRHHRFREDHAHLVGFGQVRDFFRRSRADDGQLSGAFGPVLEAGLPPVTRHTTIHASAKRQCVVIEGLLEGES